MPHPLFDRFTGRVLACGLIFVGGLAAALAIGGPYTGPVFIAAWLLADSAWHRRLAPARRRAS